MGGFKASYRGIGELLRSPMMQAEMVRRAEKVKARAEATAPVGDKDGGEYAASFKIESGVKHGKTSRAYARIANTSDHAAAVEFGWKNTPRYRTLGKALDAAKD
jgi:hypothetical protein